MIALNEIVIWSPKYSTNSVLIDVKKVKEHNKIIFTKAKHLEGQEFYITGEAIKSSPLTSNGKIPCYEVPMEKLEKMA